MKLTQSLAVIAALSTLSFAGGDINPVTVFEQEPVYVPVEPVPAPEPVYEAPAPVVEAPAPVVEAPAPVVKAPVVTPPVAVVPPKVEKASGPLGLYLAGGLTGLAASKAHADMSNVFANEKNQDRQIGFTGRLGYDFMNYLGAELRGTYGFANVANGYTKYKQVGAYLKPNYDITDALNLYGLLGASYSNHAGLAAKETGLSYGLGLDYSLSDSFSIFTDYLNLMYKENIPESSALTIGAAYKF